MELNELPPKEGVTRAYCEICNGPLDLIYAPFQETVSDVEIDIDSVPTLACPACGWRTLPDRTRFSIMRAHEMAFVSDNLNKVHLESIDNNALGKLIVSLDIACNGTRQLKRLQALLGSIADSAQT